MTSQDKPPGRRLNPFAFPSETDFRFGLLIVLIVSVCLANFFILFLTTPTTFQRAYFDTIEECILSIPLNFETATAPATDLEGLSEQIAQGSAVVAPMIACYQPVVNRLILAIFGATVAVLIGAALVFQFAPRWTIRRQQLSALTAEDVPEVNGYLDGLCAEMELRRRPTFLWNPLNATRSAFTFGNLSRQYVAMNMGLVSHYFSDRAAFRAVLLHELAHIKNADLAKTQFATALWHAFLALAVVPGLFFSLFIDPSGSGFGPLALGRLWQVALLAGLVFYVRNGILRAREYYADVRAAIYLAGPEALEQVLADTPAPARSSLSRWFATHPPTSKRVAVLNDTRPLFFATVEVAAITGVIMGIIFATNGLWANSLGGGWFFRQNAILALLLAILLMGAIGLSVWRGTTAGLLGAAGRPQLGRIALGMGVGLFLGAQVIDMAGTLNFLGTADLASIAGLQISLAAAALFGAAITYAVGRWAIAGATAWSEVAAGRRSPRVVYVGWFLVAAGITTILIYALTLAFWMSQLSFQGGFAVLAILPALFALPYYLVGSTAGTVLFLGIWALPLAAWLFRRRFRPIGEAPWGYLEPGGGDDRASGRAPGGGNGTGRLVFSLDLAARSALIVAALFLGLVILKWVVRLGQGVEPGPTVDYNDIFSQATLASLILLPILLMVRVAARAGILPISHALFAVFLLGGFMSITNNLINGLVETGRPFANPEYYWDNMQLIWGVGLLAALPVGVVVQWLGRGSKRAAPAAELLETQEPV